VIKFCRNSNAGLSRNSIFFHLVKARLAQEAILESGFISRLFDEQNPLEERLTRVHIQVKNFDTITGNVGLSRNSAEFDKSDETLLDIWNELFVIDLLINTMHPPFIDVERIVRPKSQTQIDCLAKRGDQEYAIEITRLRKRDFIGSTLPNMIEALDPPENTGDLEDEPKVRDARKNRDDLRKALKRKMGEKNKQMQEFCKLEGRSFDKKLVVIKTSQWEYQDGSKVVRDEAQILLDTGRYKYIDELLLIYSIAEFDWLHSPTC